MTMTILIFVIALGTGIVAGWLLTITTAASAISRSQARMERKVRYWQAEAYRAQALAGQIPETVGDGG
jgi:hypothetical protein